MHPSNRLRAIAMAAILTLLPAAIVLMNLVASPGPPLHAVQPPAAKAAPKKIQLLSSDVPLTITGETVTVVRKLPFTVNAPPGYNVYMWTYPSSVQAVPRGPVLDVIFAPKGDLTIGIQTIKVDFDAKKVEQLFGSITLAVGDVPTPPDPPKPPDPPGPTPGTGTHLLMVFETADVAKYPLPQLAILQGASIRTWLNGKLPPKSAKSYRWYILDKDTDVSNIDPVWKGILAAAPPTPSYVIADEQGKIVTKGPLPATVEAAQTEFGKYIGKAVKR